MEHTLVVMTGSYIPCSNAVPPQSSQPHPPKAIVPLAPPTKGHSPPSPTHQRPQSSSPSCSPPLLAPCRPPESPSGGGPTPLRCLGGGGGASFSDLAPFICNLTVTTSCHQLWSSAPNAQPPAAIYSIHNNIMCLCRIDRSCDVF